MPLLGLRQRFDEDDVARECIVAEPGADVSPQIGGACFVLRNGVGREVLVAKETHIFDTSVTVEEK